jgi:HEAT repeat protein
MHRLLFGIAIAPIFVAVVGCSPVGTTVPPPDKGADAHAAGSHPTDPLYAGRTLSTWIKLLRHGSAAERHWAAWSIGELGADAAPAVPALSRALADKTSFRTAAARSLGDIGPPAAGAIPALVKAFKKSNGFDRGIIGPAIARIGPAAVPALIAALEDDSASVRRSATYALAAVGPDAKDAVGAVLRSVSHAGEGPWHLDLDPLTRVTEGIGPGALPGLLGGLEDPETRLAAAWGLGQLGEAAAVAAPRLEQLMQADAREPRSKKARIVHARALWRVSHDPAVVPVLADLAGDDDYLVQAPAMEVLEEIGPPARAAVASLIDLLGHGNRFVREHAAKALGRIGPDARAAIPRLIAIHHELDNTERASFAKAIAAIDPTADVHAAVSRSGR